jgi:hypothetical protein
MPSNVLLGWELGAGQGHIQRLAALARVLQTHGYEPIFALKSYDLRNLQFPWQMLEAPLLTFSGREDSHTFADILATFGFADPLLLTSHIHAWQTVLKAVQPALVVTDHAPGLVLAARNRVPTIVIGSHFAVPPPVEVFPVLRFPAPPESLEWQAQVSQTVHQVMQTDVPLGQMLNGDRSFIYSLPELDCYRFWRVNPEYVGIHIAPLPSRNPQVHGSAWAYLSSSYPHYDLIMRSLHPARDFKPLQDAFVDRSLVIHHGGLTTAIGCLLSGIPQLLLPRYLEQELNAIALLRLGVSQMTLAPTWEELLLMQAKNTALIANARHQANQLAPWNHNFTTKVVDTCLQLLN